MFQLDKFPLWFRIALLLWAGWLIFTLVSMVIDYNKMYEVEYNRRVADMNEVDYSQWDCSSGVCRARNPLI